MCYFFFKNKLIIIMDEIHTKRTDLYKPVLYDIFIIKINYSAVTTTTRPVVGPNATPRPSTLSTRAPRLRR